MVVLPPGIPAWDMVALGQLPCWRAGRQEVPRLSTVITASPEDPSMAENCEHFSDIRLVARAAAAAKNASRPASRGPNFASVSLAVMLMLRGLEHAHALQHFNATGHPHRVARA
jgi:hypothetical protein